MYLPRCVSSQLHTCWQTCSCSSMLRPTVSRSGHIRICAKHNLTVKAASLPEQNLVVTAWALQPNRSAVFIFHPECVTGPSETSDSTYRVTQPHVPQDINQGMSPPDTLVGCQLMRLVNVKLDLFSSCERSYPITILSNYHKKYIFHLTEKARLPITKTNYYMLFVWKIALFSRNYTNPMCTPYWENTGFLNVKSGGMYYYHTSLMKCTYRCVRIIQDTARWVQKFWLGSLQATQATLTAG